MFDKDEIIRKMGFSYLKPYQELIVSHILENEEAGRKSKVLGCLPTGSGKTLCFMVPMLALEATAICIYPLLSLMADQERRFRQAGLECIVLKGGMTKEERNSGILALREGKAKVLLTSLEMLQYLVDQGELEWLKGKLPVLVVDEAHTVVQWGDTFRPIYSTIGKTIAYFTPTHLLAFTATMGKKTAEGIRARIFNGSQPYVVHGSSDRENIFYSAIRSFDKKEDLTRLLKNVEARPAVVFCRSREDTEKTATFLRKKRFDADFYHAGLDKEERQKKEAWFYASKDGVLAATSAYGLGVSKDDIRTIVHLSLPEEASAYLQESGRAGRDGRNATSYVLYNRKEHSPLEMVFKGKKCIRSSLLKLMNEEQPTERCLGCSSCVPSSYIPYGEKEILSYLRVFRFGTVKGLARKLTSFFPVFLPWHLKGQQEDVVEIIKDLGEEGKARIFLGLVKGPKREKVTSKRTREKLSSNHD